MTDGILLFVLYQYFPGPRAEHITCYMLPELTLVITDHNSNNNHRLNLEAICLYN